MATVYRQMYTRPLPKGAETFTRKGQTFARWTDSRGKTKTARTTTGEDGTTRLLLETSTYFTNIRDELGHPRTVSTGCTHEGNALEFVRNWYLRVEKIKLGTITAEEYAVGDHQGTPLTIHFQAYDEHLRVHVNRKTGFPASPKHRRIRQDHLNRVAKDLEWTKLAHLKREQLEDWLAEQAEKKMGPRTRNTYALSWSAFAGWCVDTHRLAVNPFTRLGRASEKDDVRRCRRALSPDDLAKLMNAAQRRPLAEYGRETQKVDLPEGEKPKRSSWTYKPVTSENITDCERRARERFKDQADRIAELQAEGRRRGLFYKTLALTGLRLNEARSLTVGATMLEGGEPFAVLAAADEKARRGAEILIRADLSEDLSQELGERLAIQQQAAKREGQPVPVALPADAPLLIVPGDAIRVLDKDLKAAGIPKKDNRGRTFDIHAFRTTFNSLLAAVGVPLTTRQILMRHAAESVTDQHYNDKTLIDVRGALEQLPRLPLDAQTESRRQAQVKEATNNLPVSDARVRVREPLTRPLTPQVEKTCTDMGNADNPSGDNWEPDSFPNADSDELCELVGSGERKRANGFEPSTFSLEG